MNRIRAVLVAGACLVLLISIKTSIQNTDYAERIVEGFYLEGSLASSGVKLVPWEDKTDTCWYLFVPSCFSGKENEFVIHYPEYYGELEIDGVLYRDKDIWRDAGREEFHSLKVKGRYGHSLIEREMQVLASENLPAAFVTVEAKDDLLSIEEFKNRQYLEIGEIKIFDAAGNSICKSDLDVFKVRGNLTAELAKKPFTFSLVRPEELFGMEPAVKWNLLANATDGAYIRNKIIRDLAYECIDAYEPQGEFVEVYLNGEYQGLYLLTEAVEVGENRIEISLKDHWYIEMELDFRAREDPTQIVTERGQVFIMHGEGISERDRAQVEARLNDVESALYAEDGISSVSGKSLGELIDLQSFAEAWLVEELSGDHDIGITSQFAYALKDEDSLWYSGPAWDFDGIMTNVNTPMYGVPEALTGVVAMSRPEDNNNQNRWMSAMWNHPEFQEKVKELYKTVFRGKYLEILKEEIGEHVDQIGRSATLDAFRWHSKRKDWWFTVPSDLEYPDAEDYRRFDTLKSHIDVIRDFMSRKIAFLDKLWLEEREFCIVEVRNPAEFLDQGYNQTLFYWVEEGEELQNLPSYEKEGYRFEGYFDVDTGELVADGTLIDRNRVIEGIWTAE